MKRIILKSLPVCCLIFLLLSLAQAAAENDQIVKADTSAKVYSLSECVAIALQTSPQVLYSQADILEKEYSLQSSKKDRYPSLFFQYGYRYAPDAYEPFGIEDYYNYSFSIEQPIYRGRSIVTGIELGELDLESSKASLVQTKNDIVLAVHEAYYNLLKTIKFEEVAKQSLAERQAHLKDSKAFFKAGLIPKNDMLQSEVQLAGAEIELIRAKNLSTMALARLNTLLRRPVDTNIELEDILKYEPSEISWEESLSQAQKYRPELKQGELAIEQADKNITLIKAPYLPAVSVSANYLKQGDDPLAQEYPLGPSEVKTALATLEWRFWAWGQNKDEVAAARHNLKKARENQTELIDNIILQVREAYLDTLEAEYNIAVTEKAIEQAEEDFRINQSRYQAQLSTTTNVLDAQTRLTRAKINYYDALYNYRISLMRLAWSTGTLIL
ncbi:MAG: TolC family protein [Desulfobulbales bacterium]|nr:TolC family protein [Desulfobulbales bacterium]